MWGRRVLALCAAAVVVGAGASGCGSGSAAGAAVGSGARQLAASDDLYSMPIVPPEADHGTLLRFQPVTPSVHPAASTWRVLYASRSVAGTPIAVSGLVVVPNTPAPDGGRRVLTVAHGTTGIADSCAPSKHPAASESSLVKGAVDAGWVIAMTDYEGLGTPGRHPYLVGESEGRGVLDAIRAARGVPGASPGSKFGIAGYSQGGHGALWAAQLAPTWTPELSLVGTFAGAPATEMGTITGGGAAGIGGGFVSMIAAGYQAAYPQADPKVLLTDEALAKLPDVDTQCVNQYLASYAHDVPGPTTRPGASLVQPWLELAQRNDPGQVKMTAPVLIVHSQDDDVVPEALSRQLTDRMCGLGQVVERRVISEGTHGAAAIPAYTQGLRWLAARFADAPSVTTCP